MSGGKQILVSEGRFIEPDHRSPSPSTSNPNSPSFKNQWESYAEEIERYLQHLLSLNLDEEDCEKENRNDIVCENSPMEAEMKELKNSNMVSNYSSISVNFLFSFFLNYSFLFSFFLCF